MRRFLLTSLLATALISAPCLSTSSAQAQAEDVQKARTYFNAGAQAYEAGEYLAAIQAFDQAYKYSPRPAILFSAAQAYRRQYFIDKNAQNLQLAIKNYRSYLSKVAEGGRRADAAQALSELEPIAARLAASATPNPENPDAPPPPAPAPIIQQTRLMVSSQTKGTQVQLDGGATKQAPLIAEVKPGKHKVSLSAPGYFPEEREVQAAEGGIVAVDVRLRPQPAKISITTESGAEVRVDGRPAGVTPLNGPLELEAGTHLITVSRTGREPYSKELDLSRGEKRTLNVDLEVTTQRVASYVVLGTGVAGLLTGGVFTFLALRQEGKAQDIDDQRSSSNITRAQVLEYEDHIAKRDDFRTASVIAYGAGALLTATSVLLMSFDDPKINFDQRERTPKTKTQEEEAPQPSMEMSAAPFWGPGTLGGSLHGRF
ncbi:MAG: PEGA domain-containing protein [Polyangiaceae bacterium]|nr:PEGA domain-containing protein [Polyangiaceae bacterium]